MKQVFIELLRFRESLASIVNISEHINVYLNNNGWLKLLLQIYILSNEYIINNIRLSIEWLYISS